MSGRGITCDRRRTTAEVRLDVGKAARFSASAQAAGWFQHLLRTRGAICRCPRRPTGSPWPRNHWNLGNVGLIEKASAVALPLLAAGAQAQLIFIDFDHRFDYAMSDFLLADAICARDGIIVFDDMWMPSIHRVVRFITNNRSDYRHKATNVQNAAVFLKVGSDERQWDH
jgi:hypothetical protein